MKSLSARAETFLLLLTGSLGLILPAYAETYALINATVYLSTAIFALSLALAWGYGGILCFGQAAFFGLGGYSYAIAAINFGDTTFAIPIAIAAPVIFAALLGYFLFYGRLSDVYLGVITLTVTLVLYKLANSTAGDAFRIGKARLGGFNGMPNTPPFNWPFQPLHVATPGEVYVVALAALIGLYLVCKWLLRTRFGRSVIGVRENQMRAELLGYDSRLLKLAIFCIGAAIAGIAGMIFANVVFVSPSMFGLSTVAQVLIWIVVGGLGTLIGPIVASMMLQMLAGILGTLNWIDPNLVLGVILVLTVLLAPGGLYMLVVRTLAAAGRLIPARKSIAVDSIYG